MRAAFKSIRNIKNRFAAFFPDTQSSDNESMLPVLERFIDFGFPQSLDFDAKAFKERVLSFVRSMQIGEFRYRYSPSVKSETLYSSVYSCLIHSLFGEMDRFERQQKKKWAEYINNFQSNEDGLFRDPVVCNTIYDDTDWWGARHLILHMLPVFASLECSPRYRFHFLKKYKDIAFLEHWLGSQDWNGTFPHANDIDNKLMNITCALQYERDFFSDEFSGRSVRFICEYLQERINPQTGMWGANGSENPADLSRMVQFAYHLYSIFFYDNMPPTDPGLLFDLTLKTQNRYGGYGVQLNSSACEDIDSIDLLGRCSRLLNNKSVQCMASFKRSLAWILTNQNSDGGFVFRRNQPLTYGHNQMSSNANESALFPTWFRALTVARLSEWLIPGSPFYYFKVPGLQYK